MYVDLSVSMYVISVSVCMLLEVLICMLLAFNVSL